MVNKRNHKKTEARLNENFTNSGINPEDVIALQIYITPEEDVKLELNEEFWDERNPEPHKAALKFTLDIIDKVHFTILEEYIQTFGAEPVDPGPDHDIPLN